MAVATLATIDLFLPGGLIPTPPFGGTAELDVARTAGFTTLVFAQLFNALNARSESTTAFHRLFVNGVALGCDRACRRAAGRGGRPAVPAGRVRHRGSGPCALGRLRRHGFGRPVGRGCASGCSGPWAHLTRGSGPLSGPSRPARSPWRIGSGTIAPGTPGGAVVLWARMQESTRLEVAREEGAMTASTPVRITPPPVPGRSHPWRWTALAALVVLALVAGGIMLLRGDAADPAPSASPSAPPSSATVRSVLGDPELGQLTEHRLPVPAAVAVRFRRRCRGLAGRGIDRRQSGVAPRPRPDRAQVRRDTPQVPRDEPGDQPRDRRRGGLDRRRRYPARGQDRERGGAAPGSDRSRPARRPPLGGRGQPGHPAHPHHPALRIRGGQHHRGRRTDQRRGRVARRPGARPRLHRADAARTASRPVALDTLWQATLVVPSSAADQWSRSPPHRAGHIADAEEVGITAVAILADATRSNHLPDGGGGAGRSHHERHVRGRRRPPRSLGEAIRRVRGS